MSRSVRGSPEEDTRLRELCHIPSFTHSFIHRLIHRVITRKLRTPDTDKPFDVRRCPSARRTPPSTYSVRVSGGHATAVLVTAMQSIRAQGTTLSEHREL